MDFYDWLGEQVARKDGVGLLACVARLHCYREFDLADLCAAVARVVAAGGLAGLDPWTWVQAAVEEFAGKGFGYDGEED